MPAAEKEQYFGARQGKNLERPASVVVDRLFDEKVVVVNKGRRQKMFFFLQEYILNKGGVWSAGLCLCLMTLQDREVE